MFRVKGQRLQGLGYRPRTRRYPTNNVPHEDLPDKDLPDEDLPDKDLPIKDLPDDDLPIKDLRDEDLLYRTQTRLSTRHHARPVEPQSEGNFR